VTGGISQITELRAGHFDGFGFLNHPGGSLINDRAINAGIQERVLGGNEVRSFRTSLNTLGDGFVECIDSNTLLAISNGQPLGMRGSSSRCPSSRRTMFSEADASAGRTSTRASSPSRPMPTSTRWASPARSSPPRTPPTGPPSPPSTP
jgi:hypothetical protein